MSSTNMNVRKAALIHSGKALKCWEGIFVCKIESNAVNYDTLREHVKQ